MGVRGRLAKGLQEIFQDIAERYDRIEGLVRLPLSQNCPMAISPKSPCRIRGMAGAVCTVTRGEQVAYRSRLKSLLQHPTSLILAPMWVERCTGLVVGSCQWREKLRRVREKAVHHHPPEVPVGSVWMLTSTTPGTSVRTRSMTACVRRCASAVDSVGSTQI